MNKIKRTFDDHPLSFSLSMVAFLLIVCGIFLTSTSFVLGAYSFVLFAAALALVFDL